MLLGNRDNVYLPAKYIELSYEYHSVRVYTNNSNIVSPEMDCMYYYGSLHDLNYFLR